LKKIRAFIFIFVATILVPGGAEATLLDICSTCTFDTVGGAEATAIDNDILEIQDSRIYAEQWEPGGIRTLRSVAGQTPILGLITGGTRGAVNLDSTAGPVTIDGIDHGLTLRTAGGASAPVLFHGSATTLTLVVRRIKTTQGVNVFSEGFQFNGSAINNSYTLEKIEFDGVSCGGCTGINFATTSGALMILSNSVFHDYQVGGSGTAIDISGSQTAIVAKLINNTIVDSGNGVDFDEPVSMINNIFADNTNDGNFTGAFSKADGIFNNFEQEPSTGWPSNNTFVTIMFVDAAADDYHLASSSNGIDDGTTSDVTDDFDGNSRPQGAAYDQGAFEFLVDGIIKFINAGVVSKTMDAGVVVKVLD